LKTLLTAKLEDRGRTCIFVGYAEDHSADCYRMWDPKTYSIHDTRDVVWLRRMYFPQRVVGQDDLIVVVPNPPTAAAIEAGESPDDEAEESPNIFSPYRASSPNRNHIESDDDASSNAANENVGSDVECREEFLQSLQSLHRRYYH
jgi:hypothetical protein